MSDTPGPPKTLELLTQILEAEQRGDAATGARLRAELFSRIKTRTTPWEQVLKWDEIPRVYREREKQDPKVEEAKITLLDFLRKNRTEVFYERQLEVLFERQFFHWVSGIALDQLEQEGSIASDLLPMWPKMPKPELRFYRIPDNR